MIRVLPAAFIVTLLGSWPATTAFADTPARLTVGEDSIEELLRLPEDLPSGRYTVHCEVIVGSQGGAKDANCFSLDKKALPTLVNEVVRAHRRAKFVPATRKGKRVDVFVQVMVLIDTTMSEPLVLAVPNNGAERKRYGLLYTGPQRFLERLRQRVHEDAFYSGRERLLVWWELGLDENGEILSIKLTDVSGASPPTLLNLEGHIKRMQFLPGYYNGHPQPMRYVQPLYSLP